MTTGLLLVQILNGLQFGILLFLVAAGLTLVFGVMDFINLAHGVQYMLGAYLAVTFVALTGSFVLGLVLALAAALVFGFADSLQQKLALLQTPIPSEFLAMSPYIATIVVVAGLVGRARPPAADGKPYVKQ